MVAFNHVTGIEWEHFVIRTIRASVCAVGILAALPAFAADYRITTEDSTLVFTGSVDGESFDGQFGRFGGTFQFDPANLAATQFDIGIEVASVDTDNAERDEVLAAPEWFDPQGHPLAQFQASGARADGNGYISDGSLQLRGVSAPVSLRYTLSADGDRLRGEAVLDRLDWQLGGPDWADDGLVGYAVKVRVDVRLR